MIDIGICNEALSYASTKSTISSINEDSIEAIQCRVHYEATRKEVLIGAYWPFARRRVALSLLDVTEQGWLYTYLYPNDCLKPLMIFPNEDGEITTEFSNLGNVRDAQNNLVIFQEGNKLMPDTSVVRLINTNAQNAVMIYMGDVQNHSIFSLDFRTAFTWALSAKLAIALSGSANLVTMLRGQAQGLLQQAMQAHSLESNRDSRPVIYNPIPTGIQARG